MDAVVVSNTDRYEYVRQNTSFPVELYPFQQKAVRELSALDRLALYFDVGTGKTLTSLAIAMYKLHTNMADTTLVIVPPVLLSNWSRNIARIPNTTQVVYAGTPAQRKRLDLNKQFIIVGIQIFKRDHKYLTEQLAHKAVFGIVDEAQALKNPASDNFKKTRDFFMSQQLCLLTGTPMSVPEDAYALIKLVSPTVYHTQYQFESIHVVERDFISNKPKTYANLDMLSKNLMLSAHRVLKEDVLLELPELTFTPIYYDLDPDHLSLYRKLADEQLVKLASGEKLDLTNVSALYQALQQVPNNAEHFSEGKVSSTSLDLIDNTLDELGTQKLVIFCHYKMTTRRLLEHLKDYGVVAVYGETRDRQAQLDKFINDPACRVIILQIQAASAGIDGLQDVCRDMLFVELPYTAAALRQAVARLHRDGQRNGVNVRVAIAKHTLQCRLWEIVMDRDALINSVIRGPQDLRDAVAGR